MAKRTACLAIAAPSSPGLALCYASSGRAFSQSWPGWLQEISRLGKGGVLHRATASVPSHAQDCQCYEITNLLWSFAELCKRQPTMAEDMADTIQVGLGCCA